MDRLNKLMEKVCGIKQNKELKDSKKPKDLNMRDMLKITRDLNEETETKDLTERVNQATAADQKREEQKFENHFSDLNVYANFDDLKVYDDAILWGGTIDGVVQFAYKVTPFEDLSGIEFNYLEDFSIENPDNQEIVDRIESYYDEFYKYWRDSLA